MGEDRQSIAVERHPLREVSELVARHCQLAAAARVRANRASMDMSDRNPEPRLGGRGKRLRALKLIFIEVDVRVEIPNRGLGHARGFTRYARAFPAGRKAHLPA